MRAYLKEMPLGYYTKRHARAMFGLHVEHWFSGPSTHPGKVPNLNCALVNHPTRTIAFRTLAAYFAAAPELFNTHHISRSGSAHEITYLHWALAASSSFNHDGYRVLACQ